MNIDEFKVENFLPYYLTEDQKKSLSEALKQFSEHSNLYTHLFMDEVLQGDCWSKVPYRDFSGVFKKINALVISNSCDISEENSRDFPVNATFAPIIYLADFENLLKNNKVPEQRIKDKIISIKQQKTTNILFLPKLGPIEQECIALLDRVFSVPYAHFKAEEEKSKITTLSQLGHYLFSFKMSVHFCRLQENVSRL